MYPGIGLRIFRVFALSCYDPILRSDIDPLDPNLKDHEKYTEECKPGGRYMTSDLSVRESDPAYKSMVTWAWFYMFLYVFGIPIAYITILYRKRKVIALDPDVEGESIHPENHQEVIQCRTEYGSLYNDYKRKYFWFELVEMTRKISLVGALVMLGESGMQIFVGIIICFFYVLLASYIEPLNSKTDQTLQYVTSVQLFCTLISGLMINYRDYERAEGRGNSTHDRFLEIWLLFSTIVVFFVIVFILSSLCFALKKIKAEKDALKEEEKNAEKMAQKSQKEEGVDGAKPAQSLDEEKTTTKARYVTL